MGLISLLRRNPPTLRGEDIEFNLCRGILRKAGLQTDQLCPGRTIELLSRFWLTRAATQCKTAERFFGRVPNHRLSNYAVQIAESSARFVLTIYISSRLQQRAV